MKREGKHNNNEKGCQNEAILALWHSQGLTSLGTYQVGRGQARMRGKEGQSYSSSPRPEGRTERLHHGGESMSTRSRARSAFMGVRVSNSDILFTSPEQLLPPVCSLSDSK